MYELIIMNFRQLCLCLIALIMIKQNVNLQDKIQTLLGDFFGNFIVFLEDLPEFCLWPKSWQQIS